MAKIFNQLFCEHDWTSEEGATPSYYCSAFSIFAMQGSILAETYVVRWWLKCKKCGKTKLAEWVIWGNNKEKELCPHCRLYVDAKQIKRNGIYNIFPGEPVISIDDISFCHNCGNETFNEERWRENNRHAFREYCNREDKSRNDNNLSRVSN